MREVKVFDYDLVINGEAVHITATKRGYLLITAAITENKPVISAEVGVEEYVIKSDLQIDEETPLVPVADIENEEQSVVDEQEWRIEVPKTKKKNVKKN